jgi:uncharacterized Tic20 family protein
MPDYLPFLDYPPTPGYEGVPGYDGPPVNPDAAGPSPEHSPPPGSWPALQAGYGLGSPTAVPQQEPWRAAPPEPSPGARPRTGQSSRNPPGTGRPHAGRASAAGTGQPPASPADARLAMLSYLTVPFFGFLVPAAVYLMALRRSQWLRAHAAQALNVWITAFLYDLSAAIMGAMLALDSPSVALAVLLPVVAALWLVTVGFLIRAATRAGEGEQCAFPAWICSPVVR